MAELVAAARGGDREAFDAVVRATQADTYALALRLTGNEEDAKDVVQEAYLRAYRGLKRFRGDASFTTWLYRITANCAATHLGRRGKHRHESLDGEAADIADTRSDIDPEERAEAALLRSRVERGAGLPAPPPAAPSWCSATSTTCPTTPSPPSWGSPRPPPRSASTGRACGCGRSCSPPGTGEEEDESRAV